VSSPRPPGWYDEPSGERALLRWWDGRAWTAVTRTRSPSEQLPKPRSVADGPAGDVLDSAGGRRPAPSRRGLVAAGFAVVVIALVVAVLPRQDPGSDRLADPAPVPTAPGPGVTTGPTPVPTTPRAVTGRVVDRVARLSYDVLPGGWREWDRDSFRGLVSTVGYYRITQDSAPNGEMYWANVTSGRVDPVVAPGDLPAAATELVDVLARGYYPGHQRTRVSRRALTVDGAPAYLVRYTAVFDPRSAEGYTAKSESVTVLLVDTGDPLPSALYVSLPDTVRSLWPSVDGLLGSVRIVR
jgi:hypothetical protein